MLTQKQELYNAIETLPDELSDKIIDYIEYVKFSYILTHDNIPERLVIKDKEDLIQKLKKGERDIEMGNVSPAKEVFARLDVMLVE